MIRAEYAAARKANPHHDGTAQAIRDALARSPEPLSRYKLSLVTGIAPEKLAWSLTQMVSRVGSVVSLPGPKGIVYTLHARLRAEEKPGGGAVTLGRYRAEFRELHRDPFAAMKLALAVRR